MINLEEKKKVNAKGGYWNALRAGVVCSAHCAASEGRREPGQSRGRSVVQTEDKGGPMGVKQKGVISEMDPPNVADVWGPGTVREPGSLPGF